MFISSVRLFSFLVIVGLGSTAHAQGLANPSGVPNHCGLGEHVFMTARLGTYKVEATGAKWTSVGKVVSLCTDKAQEPFEKMVYRFGPIGSVELEEVATASQKFFSFEAPALKAGHQGIFFNRGVYRYYVMEATGMGQGIRLLVYRSGKKLVELWSSVDEANFFSNSGLMDFEAPKSPVVASRKAPEARDFD